MSPSQDRAPIGAKPEPEGGAVRAYCWEEQTPGPGSVTCFRSPRRPPGCAGPAARTSRSPEPEDTRLEQQTQGARSPELHWDREDRAARPSPSEHLGV